MQSIKKMGLFKANLLGAKERLWRALCALCGSVPREASPLAHFHYALTWVFVSNFAVQSPPQGLFPPKVL